MNDIYVVVANGYFFDGWGSELYLLGVFTSEEKAQKCVKDNTKRSRGSSEKLIPAIHKIRLDEDYPLKTCEFIDYIYEGSVYLGGYRE